MLLSSNLFNCFFIFIIAFLPFVSQYDNNTCILCAFLSSGVTSSLLLLFCSFCLIMLLRRCLGHSFISHLFFASFIRVPSFKYRISSFSKASLELTIFACLSRFLSVPIFQFDSICAFQLI